MPTIPDVTSIKRDVASGAQDVARRTGTGDVAKGIQAVTGAVEGLIDSNAKYQASRAQADLLVAKTELDNEDFRDIEYGEIQNTYDQRFKEKREAIAKNITNPFAKQAFNQKADLLYTQGIGRAKDIARKREVDTERANMLDDLTKLREAGLNGDMLETAGAAQDLIDAGIERGYFSEEEGLKTFNKWREDAAIGRLKMMDPEDRVDALKADWAKNIPSDTRAVMMREAENAAMATKAQVNVEQWIDQDLDRLSALEKVDSIADPKLRDETRSRLNTEYDRMERNEKEAQIDAYEQAARRMEEEKVSYEELDDALLDSLTVTQRENLMKISNRRFNPRTESDPDALIRLSAAYAMQDWDEYNRIITEESELLSSDDRVKYTTKGFEAQLGEQAESGLTDVQVVAGAMADAGIEDKRTKARMLREVGRWRIRQTKLTGKEPSDSDRDKFVDYMLLEKDTNWFWFVGDKPMLDRPPEEQLEVLAAEDPDALDTIREYYKKRGVTQPTAQDVIDLYAKIRPGE